VIIPPALLLLNFLGFSYAYLVRPQRAARTPYLRAILPDTEPLLPTYTDYLKDLLDLDLGMMPTTEETLVYALANAAVASLGLLGLALGLSVVIGFLLGLVAVRVEPPRVSRWLPLFSTIGLAMPSFYIGSLFVVFLFSLLMKRPNSGFLLPMGGFGWDLHLVLPTLSLMLRPIVHIAQMTSGLLVGELEKQYVVTARSIGNPWSVVRMKHTLRNVLAPVVLSISRSMRVLVGDLILVEWLFSWPGLGNLLAVALIPSLISFDLGSPLFLDPPVVATLLILIGALFLMVDLVASVLVRVIDPRLRAMDQGEISNV
jgi:peptide/nickel transport system permease protein